jgi:hypothetical protein
MSADTKPSRKIVTAQNMDEAKTATYANDPQTELVILGLGENPSVTTCGWVNTFLKIGRVGSDRNRRVEQAGYGRARAWNFGSGNEGINVSRVG